MLSLYRNLTSRFHGTHARSPPEFNVLMLGLNNSGKSTLLRRICAETEEQIRNTVPTVDMVERDVNLKNLRVRVRDISGQWRMRQLWHNYYQNTNILIYVVDSTDATRLSEARCELCDILLDERMCQVPLLVLANKQDVHCALPTSMIVELMGLDRLEARVWHIIGCNSKQKEGVLTTTDWIYRTLKKQQSPSRLKKFFNPMTLFGPRCLVDCRRPVDA